MMFQSTTAESIGHSGNNDRYPYEVVPGSTWPEIKPERVDTRVTAAALMYVRGFEGEVYYRPRPSFDRPPVNPILQRARLETLDVEWFLFEYNHRTDHWIWGEGAGITAESVAHAYRVLSLLVAVSG